MGKLADAYLAIIPKLDASAMNSSVEGIKGKLGDAAKTGLKAFAAVSAAATAAGVAMVKSALDGYAAYEQNVGGMQKLYGGASQTMIEQAQNAYKTCGMSANQYMEQASSFSAALVNSLSGDTQAAAAQAQKAMVAMSDNVNTFGTDMVDVTNAFQGFAKQNYTMLDNLKLGYGGTQSEMKRLISDANEYAASIGMASDLSIDSFSDIVTAIDLIQQKQNIAGTTSKEAATTIEGSINSMKAAWENWLTSLGSDDWDVSTTTENLVQAFATAAENVIPRIAQIFQGITQALPEALAGISEVLVPVLSDALASAWNIAVGALAGIGIVLPTVDSSQLLSSANEAMELAKLALTDPEAFFERGHEIASSISSGLAESVPDLVSQGLDALGQLAAGFHEWLPELVSMGGEMLLGLAQGLMDSLPTLIEKLPQIVSDIANGISEACEVLRDVGLQTLVIIGQGLIEAIPTLIANIPQILQAVWDAFVAFQWVALGTGIIEGIAGGISALGETIPTKLKGFLDEGVQHATQFASDLAGKGLKAGSEFLLNLATNVSQAPGRLAGSISEMLLNAGGFVGELGAKATSAGQGFLSGLSGKLAEAVSFAGSIPGRIKGAIGNVGSILVSAGKSIINGFLRGLKSAWGNVTDFVGGIAGWISSHKGPISYDRKLLIPNGRAITDSLLDGLKSSYGDVQGFVSGIAGDISGGIGPIEVATAASVPNAALVGAVRDDATGSARTAGGSGSAADLSRVVALLEAIRDKDADVYMDSTKVSAALALRSRYAMAGRGAA